MGAYSMSFIEAVVHQACIHILVLGFCVRAMAWHFAWHQLITCADNLFEICITHFHDGNRSR